MTYLLLLVFICPVKCRSKKNTNNMIKFKENRRVNQDWTINPEALATLGRQDTGRRQTKHENTTQKTKKNK